MQRKKKTEGKIKNATPNIYDGIKFRSKLETYCYKALKEAGIAAEYEPKSYTLLPKFTFDNATVRAITYKPDFIGDGFVIECKGFPNDAFPLREKLFKYYLINNEPNVRYYLVHTQKEVNALITKLKEN